MRAVELALPVVQRDVPERAADLAQLRVALLMVDPASLEEALPVVELVLRVVQRAVPEQPVAAPELSAVSQAVGLARPVV
jgi:hypothetical protein